MAVRQSSKSSPVQFPDIALRKALSDFWKKEIAEKEEDPFEQTEGTLYEVLPRLGSLTIVRSFTLIGKIMNMKIPVTLIKKGGYDSHDELINDLLPKLKELYKKRAQPVST